MLRISPQIWRLQLQLCFSWQAITEVPFSGNLLMPYCLSHPFKQSKLIQVMLILKIFSQDDKGTMSHLLRRVIEGAHPVHVNLCFLYHILWDAGRYWHSPQVQCVYGNMYSFSEHLMSVVVIFFFKFDGFHLYVVCVCVCSFIYTFWKISPNYTYITSYKKKNLFYSKT